MIPPVRPPYSHARRPPILSDETVVIGAQPCRLPRARGAIAGQGVSEPQSVRRALDGRARRPADATALECGDHRAVVIPCVSGDAQRCGPQQVVVHDDEFALLCRDAQMRLAPCRNVLRTPTVGSVGDF